MKLWIRSQDRKELRPQPKLGIDKLENKYYIVDRYNFESAIILGVYETEERALEVLDEIQNAILGIIVDEDVEEQGKKRYTGTDIASRVSENIVYEMPKE